MILCLIDHDRGKLNEVSLQTLTLGKKIADELGVGLEAVVVGENARSLTDGLQAYGVSKAHLVTHVSLDDYAPEAWAQSIVGLAESLNPEAIFTPGTEQGNEVLAHVAARLGEPMAANCSVVTPGDTFEVTRVRWGGSLLEDANLSGTIKLLSSAPHLIAAEAAAADSFELNEVTPELSDKDFRVKVTRRELEEGDKVSLTDAKFVVSGGRGVGSSEGFEKLEQLAGMVGGAVGCSRAVTSHGWRPHSDQVGQTGARVAPELYIAAGISGAIQHYIGCKGAKHILAINTDKDAPIVSKSDYLVVGDLHEVLPAVTEELKKQGYA